MPASEAILKTPRLMEFCSNERRGCASHHGTGRGGGGGGAAPTMRGAEEMAAAPWQWGAEEVATIVALRGDGRAAGAEEEVAAVPS